MGHWILLRQACFLCYHGTALAVSRLFAILHVSINSILTQVKVTSLRCVSVCLSIQKVGGSVFICSLDICLAEDLWNSKFSDNWEFTHGQTWVEEQRGEKKRIRFLCKNKICSMHVDYVRYDEIPFMQIHVKVWWVLSISTNTFNPWWYYPQLQYYIVSVILRLCHI